MASYRGRYLAEVTNAGRQEKGLGGVKAGPTTSTTKVQQLVRGIENMEPHVPSPNTHEAKMKKGRKSLEGLAPKNRPRFAKGIPSPVPSEKSRTVRRLEPPSQPSPSEKVSAQLLATSEGHARGLQKLNDSLREELVAAELKADAADNARLSLEEYLEKARLENESLSADLDAEREAKADLERLHKAEQARLTEAVEALQATVAGAEKRIDAVDAVVSAKNKDASELKKQFTGLSRRDLVAMNAANAKAMADAIETSIKHMADAQIEYLKLLIQHSETVVPDHDDATLAASDPPRPPPRGRRSRTSDASSSDEHPGFC